MLALLFVPALLAGCAGPPRAIDRTWVASTAHDVEARDNERKESTEGGFEVPNIGGEKWEGASIDPWCCPAPAGGDGRQR